MNALKSKSFNIEHRPSDIYIYENGRLITKLFKLDKLAVAFYFDAVRMRASNISTLDKYSQKYFR